MTTVAYALNDLWEVGNDFLPDVVDDYERAQRNMGRAAGLDGDMFASEALGVPGNQWAQVLDLMDQLLKTSADIMTDAGAAVRMTVIRYAEDEEYNEAEVHLDDDLREEID